MRSRIIMSMFAGATLLASTLLGATPAQSADTLSRSADTLSRSVATPSRPIASPSRTDGSPAVPAEFGTDWHDPITAAPPVSRPENTSSCEVTVAEARFKDFTPYRGTYTPPAECGKKWSKVVLRLDGKVKGRQFDRLGHLRIGGVEVFRTSTPQPSPDGIEWSVEKDVTRYSETLRSEQPVEMLIGNVVDDTYTGIIDVKVRLTFYAGRPDARTARTVPDRVLTLQDGTGLTTPRNSERIVAEVYATGSGGGCEEYWYLTVPDEAPYSCKADDGPYREVRIEVDGQLAGIAAPFPNVWTGGWSNPFLWYVVPGPRAFDIQPLRYDLTPFAGLLNDGRPHRIEVSVAGVPEGQSGWSTPVNVLVWQDEKSEHVTGALTKVREGDFVNSSTYTPGAEHRLDTEGSHRLTVAGYVDTSHGRVTTTVRRSLLNTSTHTWSDGENPDALDARWRDDETVTVNHRTTRVRRSYTMDGTTTLGAGDRLRTVLTLGDRATVTETHGGRRTAWSRLDDTYTGDATYTANVPRDQRHAVGTTSERYRTYGSDGCYDRSLVSVQGVLTEDQMGC
ncbi:peptide-N4-asparagine amidase A [Streptomyces caniscabiei]|uniref:Peptide-N4-asparagine amidase A n=1 Tax=Streptomyces caniscabiei TaxID=2746961 RepID=A0A927L8M9_9ACTN|nr:peptide-N4-asparagine amidase [Streptomyces caniscabiei]MBD9727397.1 peptide-N4-asparagine amidase A [Streptomyces caniscabiei]MDX3512714.1 peptide-N4-asparagine amidase A [Streptomyces caniscabiei]MDX3722239.1 peptide-N4-asparagine amidase A [Streptomyces caniscabiei]MDX3730773.1 peptide-N4-asparagine amidase A [Streptomyces caniscabiei]WEO28781.1 peptide-N4-asparagine amidase A [Streptomyces caniscabiei]